MNKSETYVFEKIPTNVEELKAIPESSLNTPFMTAALTTLVLCNYGNNVDNTIEMINFLKGPQPLSPYEKQFLRDRLVGKEYVPMSYFNGTSPENDYMPTMPLTITVSDYAYSYNEEGYANIQLKSSGADSPRSIKLRKKGEQWFLWENYALSDIRKPKKDDVWA